MCTSDGKLYHRNFGFILGRDPNPIAPYVRITPSMVEAMGGPGKEKFVELCQDVYKVIR